MGHQFHWDAETYLDRMHAEVACYDRLQEEAVEATREIETGAILELGTGTGETARRLLARHSRADLIGIDSSEQMLASAARLLDPGRVDLRIGRIEDALPEGPFDLVVAALVIHHLAGERKAELFRRVRPVLRPGGRFVVADVVLPEDAADAITPLSPDYDRPSGVGEQVAWLERAGLAAIVTWRHRDLAVIAADRRA